MESQTDKKLARNRTKKGVRAPYTLENIKSDVAVPAQFKRRKFEPAENSKEIWRFTWRDSARHGRT